MSTPPRRCAVKRSPASACANSAANSGVVAFKIAARPLAMCFCPQRMSANGTTLFRRLKTAKLRHAARERGRRPPVRWMTATSASAAKPARPNTTVSGSKVPSRTLLKKNEPPQNSASTSSIAHSAALIARGRDGSAAEAAPDSAARVRDMADSEMWDAANIGRRRRAIYPHPAPPGMRAARENRVTCADGQPSRAKSKNHGSRESGRQACLTRRARKPRSETERASLGRKKRPPRTPRPPRDP